MHVRDEYILAKHHHQVGREKFADHAGEMWFVVDAIIIIEDDSVLLFWYAMQCSAADREGISSK